MSGYKLEGFTRSLCGDIGIADTWRSFFCVTTDLVEAVEMVHRVGLMWAHIRASMTLPGIFPPQVDGERLLVDGCLLNNYPANIMHGTSGCGTVIGVKATGESDLLHKNQYGGSLSGWELLNVAHGYAVSISQRSDTSSACATCSPTANLVPKVRQLSQSLHLVDLWLCLFIIYRYLYPRICLSQRRQRTLYNVRGLRHLLWHIYEHWNPESTLCLARWGPPLNRFGLRLGVLANSAVVTSLALLLLIIQFFFDQLSILFWLVVVTKVSDDALAVSINSASTRILLQPLPIQQRVRCRLSWKALSYRHQLASLVCC